MDFETEKTLLICGFNDEEESTLRKLLEENSLPQHKVIKDNMADITIGDILSDVDSSGEGYNLPKEKIVLFNKCQDDEVMRCMKVIKANFTEKPIFAMVTPTSIQWKFKDLLEHLMQERKWYENRTKKPKGDIIK
ncbi:DUF3783 domain-containing protein [Clostridium bovifaecis]|uniref:DUF3783 domain-containing protein n=1 Tax=Clostridium bovifaecis TaxID=2184719 RepID=A0A6I6EJE7_9CLOT|nr:DUF3783 domain-containing protein [Clostridium bovifaecis]